MHRKTFLVVWVVFGIFLCTIAFLMFVRKAPVSRISLKDGEGLEVFSSSGEPLVALNLTNREMGVEVFKDYKPFFHITRKTGGTNGWTLFDWSNNNHHVDTYDLNCDGIPDMRKITHGTKKTTQLFLDGKFQEATISNCTWVVMGQPVEFVNGIWISSQSR